MSKQKQRNNVKDIETLTEEELFQSTIDPNGYVKLKLNVIKSVKNPIDENRTIITRSVSVGTDHNNHFGLVNNFNNYCETLKLDRSGN